MCSCRPKLFSKSNSALPSVRKRFPTPVLRGTSSTRSALSHRFKFWTPTEARPCHNSVVVPAGAPRFGSMGSHDCMEQLRSDTGRHRSATDPLCSFVLVKHGRRNTSIVVDCAGHATGLDDRCFHNFQLHVLNAHLLTKDSGFTQSNRNPERSQFNWQKTSCWHWYSLT